MRCEAFESRLHQILDRRQRPEHDDQLRAHALGCPTCHRMLDAQERLFAGLELFDAPRDEAPQSAVIVRDLLQAESAPRKRKKARWIGPLILLAASLLVAALAWSPPTSPSTAPQADDLVVQPSQPFDRDLAVDTVQSLHDGLDSAGQAGEYLGNIASTLPEQLPTVDSLSRIDSPVLSKGLRPLASSFNSAFTVIRRTIPVGRGADPNSPQAYTHIGALPKV